MYLLELCYWDFSWAITKFNRFTSQHTTLLSGQTPGDNEVLAGLTISWSHWSQTWPSNMHKSFSRSKLTPPQVKKETPWLTISWLSILKPGMETEVVYDKLVLIFIKYKEDFLHPQAYNRLPIASGLKQVFVVKFKCNCMWCFVSFAYVKLKRSATPW